jgi:microcystin-dependent protein
MSPIIPGDLNDWYALLARIDALEQANKAQTFNVGDLKMSCTGVPSSGWLEANGQGVTTTFLILRNALIAAGSPHGTDGSGNPRIPDFTRRVPIGRGGGTALGNVTGVETVTLTTPQMPSHAHVIQRTGQLFTPQGSFYGFSGPQLNSGTDWGVTQGAGGDQPHTNMQPSVGIIVLVKT